MTISSKDELLGMQRVGRLVAQTIARMREEVRPGVTTGTLDAIAERFARAEGARSAPQLAYNFPGFTCISVNDEVVHGIPGPRKLAPGDMVKLDVTLELDGFMADSAVTVLVPPITPEAQKLQRAARQAFKRGLDAARAGRRLSEIGAAVEASARKDGVSVLRELSGHGIGRTIHEEPSVPNWPSPEAHRVILHDGLVLALEPMLAARKARTVDASDGWTVKTSNGAFASHHEHTIVIRRGEPLVLTAA
ncbi:MAG TPA: type I methionyl aminopeptidase [Thermoanaerobaculia bacterium]|nr:type I methionyl aminopeptidase [Thermoanaerobaculia bacterium]